jgi:hypothetical protein
MYVCLWGVPEHHLLSYSTEPVLDQHTSFHHAFIKHQRQGLRRCHQRSVYAPATKTVPHVHHSIIVPGDGISPVFPHEWADFSMFVGVHRRSCAPARGQMLWLRLQHRLQCVQPFPSCAFPTNLKNAAAAIMPGKPCEKNTVLCHCVTVQLCQASPWCVMH